MNIYFMAYRQKREVTFPILADGGSKTGLLLEEKADQITEVDLETGFQAECCIIHITHIVRGRPA